MPRKEKDQRKSYDQMVLEGMKRKAVDERGPRVSKRQAKRAAERAFNAMRANAAPAPAIAWGPDKVHKPLRILW